MSSNSSQKTVFYSWQSDLPNRSNRTFIGDALQKAVDAILEADLEIDLVLARDTQGTPGAPDIAKTILDKIDRAAVVVADVSIVSATGDGRPTPNPNVLFELGYAVRALSWDAVLPVLNLATGRIEDLPFDLRARRPVTYLMNADVEDKRPELRKIARTLQEALQLIITEQRQRIPTVQIVFQRSPMRWGVRNSGSVPIEVIKFTFEYPKSIDMNSGHPFSHAPIVRVDEGIAADSTPIWRMTLVRTDAPIAYGYVESWRLPPRIDPGETEIFQVPAFGFKDSAPSNTAITAKLSLSQGNPISQTTTLGELLDPSGCFAP